MKKNSTTTPPQLPYSLEVLNYRKYNGKIPNEPKDAKVVIAFSPSYKYGVSSPSITITDPYTPEEFQAFETLPCRNALFLIGHSSSDKHKALVASVVPARQPTEPFEFKQRLNEYREASEKEESEWLKKIAPTLEKFKHKGLKSQTIPYIWTYQDAREDKDVINMTKFIIDTYLLHFSLKGPLGSDQTTSPQYKMAEAFNNFIEDKITRNYNRYIKPYNKKDFICIAQERGVTLDYNELVHTTIMNSAALEMAMMVRTAGPDLEAHCLYYKLDPNSKTRGLSVKKEEELISSLVALIYPTTPNLLKVVRYKTVCRTLKEEKQLDSRRSILISPPPSTQPSKEFMFNKTAYKSQTFPPPPKKISENSTRKRRSSTDNIDSKSQTKNPQLLSFFQETSPKTDFKSEYPQNLKPPKPIYLVSEEAVIYESPSITETEDETEKKFSYVSETDDSDREEVTLLLKSATQYPHSDSSPKLKEAVSFLGQIITDNNIDLQTKATLGAIVQKMGDPSYRLRIEGDSPERVHLFEKFYQAKNLDPGIRFQLLNEMLESEKQKQSNKKSRNFLSNCGSFFFYPFSSLKAPLKKLSDAISSKSSSCIIL